MCPIITTLVFLFLPIPFPEYYNLSPKLCIKSWAAGQLLIWLNGNNDRLGTIKWPLFLHEPFPAPFPFLLPLLHPQHSPKLSVTFSEAFKIILHRNLRAKTFYTKINFKRFIDQVGVPTGTLFRLWNTLTKGWRCRILIILFPWIIIIKNNRRNSPETLRI